MKTKTFPDTAKGCSLIMSAFYSPKNVDIVVAINMFRFKRGNCLSVLEIVKKELECNIVYLLR